MSIQTQTSFLSSIPSFFYFLRWSFLPRSFGSNPGLAPFFGQILWIPPFPSQNPNLTPLTNTPWDSTSPIAPTSGLWHICHTYLLTYLPIHMIYIAKRLLSTFFCLFLVPFLSYFLMKREGGDVIVICIRLMCRWVDWGGFESIGYFSLVWLAIGACYWRESGFWRDTSTCPNQSWWTFPSVIGVFRVLVMVHRYWYGWIWRLKVESGR